MSRALLEDVQFPRSLDAVGHLKMPRQNYQIGWTPTSIGYNILEARESVNLPHGYEPQLERNRNSSVT